MKKRRIIIPIIMLLVVAGVPCLINMSNFGLGSNIAYFRTVDDYSNTVWICDEPKAMIAVTERKDKDSENWNPVATLSMEEYGKEVCFKIDTVAGIFILNRLDENGNEIDPAGYSGNPNRIVARASYRKNIFGEVTSFKVRARDKKQTIFGYKKLKFKRQK